MVVSASATHGNHSAFIAAVVGGICRLFFVVPMLYVVGIITFRRGMALFAYFIVSYSMVG